MLIVMKPSSANRKAPCGFGPLGVPTFVFENEPFFSQDRIRPLVWTPGKGLIRRSGC
jgi:2-hydroxychromene-2-carboxylate isomerase